MGLGAPAPWPQPGEHSPNNSWRIDGMEGVDGGAGDGGGGPGLRFLLQFDPGNPGLLDRTTLLGFSLSALFSRLLGWSKAGHMTGGGSRAIAADGGDDSGNAAVSAAALAAAASLCLAAMYASDHRPRRAPRPLRRLPAPALPAPTSAPRPRALPGPRDGLRILSSNPTDESPDNVIHGASIGAGDDEPDIVARVEMDPMPLPAPVPAAANANDETETEPPCHPEEAEEEERKELQRLRELWLSLLEREQRLELRLQELEGLRSQEATVRDLESRVAAADAEARLLRHEVATLQEDNGRLRAQAEELDAARAELARAREKLRAIKARVQDEQDEAAALRARVAELESGGEERARALAAEVAELREANAALEEDNMELALRLQDAEQVAPAAASVNLVPQESMAEEMTYLRESNERLTRQIEQLRNDHCAHVEELVYLKWVNACLRHELLRDHDGHPAAEQQDRRAGAGSRDDLSSALELSKSMSFRSSERAKQLMLRYGHPGLDGFDPAALFSPLHESVDDGERSPANNYEPERSPCARPGTAMAASPAAAAPGKKAGGPRKLKLLGNIRKLLPGGKRSNGHGHGHHHAGRDGRKAPAPRDEYLEKAMQWLSTHDVLDGDHSYESTPLSSCDRTPLSSVTTNTTAGSRARCDGGQSEREETAHAEAEPILTRSKSDAGGAYGREGSRSRYHALRPEHPASSEADEPDGFRAPEKREARRRSLGLRSPAVA